MKPVQLFCWHFMAYPYLAKDFDEKYDTRLGHRAEPAVGQRQGARALSRIHRPVRLCRRARLRRHGAQRASSEHLRPDAVAQSHRRGADAKAPSAAKSSCSAISCRCISIRCASPRNTRCSTNERRPADRRLRARRRAGDVQLQRAVGRTRGNSSGKRPISSCALDRATGRSPTKAATFRCAT